MFCTQMRREQVAFFKACLADALLQLMQEAPFETISVSQICARANVGRTTYYRHYDRRSGKEDLLVFKVQDAWAGYVREHPEEAARDRGFAIACYVYEKRELFALLHRQKLLTVLMRAFEALVLDEDAGPGGGSYLAAFFAYGYFGMIYRWICHGFDVTPQQLQKQILDAWSGKG